MPSEVRRTVTLLTLGAYASSASMRMCDPLLPRLASEFGVSLSAAAGTITGFAVAYGVLQLVIGPISDRLGKFQLVTWATALAAVAALACALAPDMGWLMVARVLAGAVGGAIIPVALAWIGDEVPYEHRQPVLASLMSGGLLGLITGQLASGILADTLGWRWAFVLVAALFGGVAWRMARSPAARRPLRGGGTAAGGGGWLSWYAGYFDLMRPRWVRLILLCAALEGVLMYGAMSFVPTALHEGFGVPIWQAAMVSSVIGAGGFAYTLIARRVLAVLGERGLALVGGSLVALGLLTIGLAPVTAVAVLGALVLGLGFYGFHNTLQTHGTQLSATQRGMGMALFAMFFFAGQSVGVALAAAAVARVGFAPTFGAAALAFWMLALGLQHALGRRAALRAPSAPAGEAVRPVGDAGHRG